MGEGRERCWGVGGLQKVRKVLVNLVRQELPLVHHSPCRERAPVRRQLKIGVRIKAISRDLAENVALLLELILRRSGESCDEALLNSRLCGLGRGSERAV